MALESIKSKYRQILQERESSSDSDQEWQLACSKMHRKKTHNENNILGQSQALNLNKSKCFQTGDGPLLRIKEKLAQTLANLNQRDRDVVELKQRNVRLTEGNKALERQVGALRANVSDYEREVIDQKVAYNVLEKEVEGLQRRCDEHLIDKDLMLNQVDFYQHEVETYKIKVHQERKEYECIAKDISSISKVRGENDRLRNDVKRLHYLLEETERYHKLPRQIQSCHYLGRAEKQSDMWFPQDLIGEAEHFLKKWQLTGNLDFVHGLVKFVEKQTRRGVKEATSRAKKLEGSRRTEIERRHNQSLGMHAVIQSNSLGKSQQLNNSCFLKGSRKFSQYPQPKICTESFIYEKLDKSLVAHEYSEGKRLCLELFQQFKHTILVMLTDPKPKRRKIIKLIDWVCESGIELICSEIRISKQKQIKIAE